MSLEAYLELEEKKVNSGRMSNHFVLSTIHGERMMNTIDLSLS